MMPNGNMILVVCHAEGPQAILSLCIMIADLECSEPLVATCLELTSLLVMVAANVSPWQSLAHTLQHGALHQSKRSLVVRSHC